MTPKGRVFLAKVLSGAKSWERKKVTQITPGALAHLARVLVRSSQSWSRG